MKSKLIFWANRILASRYSKAFVRAAYCQDKRASGLHYFTKNEMAPEFDWRKYEKIDSPFFQKYGISTSVAEGEFYAACNGIRSDLYLTRDVAFHYIYPCLCRYQYIPAYADKIIQPAVLGLAANRLARYPKNIVFNQAGIYYAGELGNEITMEAAADLVVSSKEDLILKPTIGSYGGQGVRRIKAGGISRADVFLCFKEYGRNFTFQNRIRQHSDMSSFNVSSLNTIRIATYRDFSGRIKVPYAFVRFGSPGTFCDNSCAGGGAIAIRDDGTLACRHFFVYGSMKPTSLGNGVVNQIPNYDAVRKAVLELHKRLPHYNYVAWDIAIDEEGTPTFVEYNIRPGTGGQQTTGPFFQKSDLEEIMHRVAQMKVGMEIQPWLAYPVRPGHRTWPCAAY